MLRLSYTNMNDFNWKKFDYLGHKFNPLKGSSINHGWSECYICNVKVYIDPESHFADKLMCWDYDLFHENKPITINININYAVTEFNLSCNEIMIKKIIE